MWCASSQRCQLPGLVRALAVETRNWLEAIRYLNMDHLKEHKKITSNGRLTAAGAGGAVRSGAPRRPHPDFIDIALLLNLTHTTHEVEILFRVRTSKFRSILTVACSLRALYDNLPDYGEDEEDVSTKAALQLPFSMFQNTGLAGDDARSGGPARVAVGRVYWPRWMCVPYCTARACSSTAIFWRAGRSGARA